MEEIYELTIEVVVQVSVKDKDEALESLVKLEDGIESIINKHDGFMKKGNGSVKVVRKGKVK